MILKWLQSLQLLPVSPFIIIVIIIIITLIFVILGFRREVDLPRYNTDSFSRNVGKEVPILAA
jgi:hypothetical protein